MAVEPFLIKMSIRKVLIIVILFLAVLTGIRLWWMSLYVTPSHPTSVQGILDLRDWEQIEEMPVKLDGEWEFFSNQFIQHSPPTLSGSQTITIPNVWEESKGTSDTYGYGTYRLRVLVDLDKAEAFGIAIPKVGSSAKLFVNGHPITGAGIPASSKEAYTPSLAPMKMNFTVEKTDEIELLLHVANFDDPFNGGITRSITFGKADAFNKRTTFESNIVYFACLLYLFHALYSIAIYFVGKRDKRLLFFAVLILLIVMATLIGEREFYALFPLHFEWGIKMTNLICIAGGYVFFYCIKNFLPALFRSKISLVYSWTCAIAIVFIFLTPASTNLRFIFLYIGVMLLPTFVAPVLLFRVTRTINTDTIYLLLATIAGIYSLFWFIIIEFMNIDMVSYPFDLMTAIVCFATYWFKQYFRVLDESQQLTLELQEADKQREDFLLRVAHEMRNPLHGMLNISQAVAEREKNTLQQKSQHDLDLLVSVGKRMSLLLNDLLDLARFKENKIVIHSTAVSIHSVVNGVIDMLQYMMEKKPIQFDNQIPPKFPLVQADENRLIQIVFNLLYNAVKHSEAKDVIIRAFVDNESVIVSINDNGIGINEPFLQTIFEPYEQLHSKAVDEGFGLGLNICKQLVELHGGTLHVTSTVNEGTTFTFTLKLADSTTLDSQPILKTTGHASSFLASSIVQDAPAQAVRILAVDDDPVNLNVLQSIFSTTPYMLYTTMSANEVLTLLDGMNWDLVIADVMMPEMSGYTLTSLIREKYTISELPVLLLTAFNREEDIEAGFRAGANDYVQKPVNAVELKSRVESLTKLKRSVHERLRMEAAWLHAQIKPHFMFNTFNTIAALSRIDLDRMDALLHKLSEYIHLSIDFQNEDGLTTLDDEMKLVHAYTYILKERFRDRFHVKWEVADNIELLIPPLTIQTLVENAINHGVLKRLEGGEIIIRIQSEETGVTVSVLDNGVGMERETVRQLLSPLPGKHTGIGLLNTDRRLKQLFGSGLTIKSTLHAGTTVSFTIPYRANNLPTM